MGSICYGLISLISRFLCWEVDDYIDYYNIIVWGKTIRISIYLDNLINLYGEIGTCVVQLFFKLNSKVCIHISWLKCVVYCRGEFYSQLNMAIVLLFIIAYIININGN